MPAVHFRWFGDARQRLGQHGKRYKDEKHAVDKTGQHFVPCITVRETTVRVVLECFDDGVQNVPDGGVLDGVVGAREIFVDGFQPPHVVVRVGYDVDRQGP